MWPVLYIAAAMYSQVMKHPSMPSVHAQPLENLARSEPPHLIPEETWDCSVPGSLIDFKAATISPDPILYPGSIFISSTMEVLKEIPKEDFYVKIALQKTSPKKMKVPCFQKMGSCSYDVCNDLIPNNYDAFCSIGLCGCPFEPKEYIAKDIPYKIPERGGPIFAKIMEGGYVGNMTFYNKKDNTLYGCMGMKFTIKAKDKLAKKTPKPNRDFTW